MVELNLEEYPACLFDGEFKGGSIATKEPVSEECISEALQADLVIIGGGISGSVAAATAVEEGKTVIVLQKCETALSHGFGAAAWNSKAQKEAGISFDPWEAVGAWTRQGENRADLSLIKTWIYNSGPTIDWVMDKSKDIETLGPVFLGADTNMEYPDSWNLSYPTTHAWMKEMRPLAQWLLDYAEDTGLCRVLYKTPAVQLLRSDNGEGGVYGVIAQTDTGEYIKVEANNAVILAAGDYGNNPLLRAIYLPHIEGLGSVYERPDINKGDGHFMGMHIGCKMQLAPHCSNIHYDPPFDVPDIPGSGIPWLFVNLNGKRFCNEDMEYGQLYAQNMIQPEFAHFQVFDDNFRTDWVNMGSGMMKKEPPKNIVKGIENGVANGEVYQADSIELLAEAIGVPADALENTVNRYNQLCDKGYDNDFGKQAARLKAVRKAPFYAIKRRPGILCTLGGLITDDQCRAIDTNDEVIDGLYIVGNCQGNFFGGLEHQMVIPGMSLGRAMTTGRVAALLACGKEIFDGTEWE